MKAQISPFGKLDRLPSKKTCFQWKNGTVLTGFKGGLILSLPLLLLTISTHELIMKLGLLVRGFFNLFNRPIVNMIFFSFQITIHHSKDSQRGFFHRLQLRLVKAFHDW